LNLRRALTIFVARIFSKKLGLSHGGDADGIISAALFLRANPDAYIVFAEPWEVNKGIIKLIKWDFVADLPSPKKAKVRVDHHQTNEPGADLEYHDPQAPSAASLAIKALKLESDSEAVKLVELANQCDTANISSSEAWDLNDAVKGASYGDKVKLAKLLAVKGVKTLQEPFLKPLIEKNRRRRIATYALVEKLPISEVMVMDVDNGERFSIRGLMIELEKRGAKLTCALTPRVRGYKLHVGARVDSEFDSAELASKLGGGGHKWAAGAIVDSKERAYKAIKEYLCVDKLRVFKVNASGEVEEMVV